MQTYPITTAPATPFTTFIVASQLGLALNCDLMTGLDKTTGLAADDDGPAINAAMAGATADNPLCLILDGSCAVSGLKMPSGGHWSIRGFGWDTGIFMIPGSNFHGISNTTTTIATDQGTGAPPSRGANVSIRDLFINGSRGTNYAFGTITSGSPVVTGLTSTAGITVGAHVNIFGGVIPAGTTVTAVTSSTITMSANATATGGYYNVVINGNSTTGDPRGNLSNGWYFGINLRNLNGVRIEGVRLYQTPAFQITLDNCGDWTVDRCHFENVLPTQDVYEDNSDGVHVNGPSDRGRITNSYFRTGDDCIAFNAREGYGGPIVNMAVDNIVLNQCINGPRIYTDNIAASAVSGLPVYTDTIVMSNVVGTVSRAGFSIGVGQGSSGTLNSNTNILCKGWRIAAAANLEGSYSECNFAFIQENVGTLTFSDCDAIGIPGAGGMLVVGGGNGSPGTGPIITDLAVNNCRAVRNANGSSIGVLFDNVSSIYGILAGTAEVKRFRVNGFALVDIGGSYGSGALIAAGANTVLNSVQIDAIDASNITALMGSGSSSVVSSLAGGAVLQTGWSIADSIMAKWTPYVSASSSLPSYKNASGTIVPL